MKKLKDMTIEELSFMSAKEIENIPPQEFGTFTSAGNMYKLDAMTWDIWNKMTYAQLSHIGSNAFSLLKEDVVTMLIDKFKDKQEVIIINKQIKDKIVPIQSLPLAHILKQAQRQNKEIKKMVNESMQVYQQYKDMNIKNIPESDIRKILMLKSLDTETLKLLQRFDTLPYLVRSRYILFWFELNKYQKSVKEYLRTHPDRFCSYKIQKHTYYRYEDVIQVIAAQ